ncbi:glycoside hydrolase family 125 protein [bacterium]|nr:glycoside hydrolase family 125 protein [bacterium]
MKRRQFLTLAAALGLSPLLPALPASRRPERPSFRSPAVEAYLRQAGERIRDTELGWLFQNCFPNTLDTTVRESGGQLWVITGDIDAMWLRDSTNQVWPYLPLAPGDDALTRLFRGLIATQSECVLLDPYANAFLTQKGQTTPFPEDRTEMKAGIHERKWEVDSLASVLRLSHGYWEISGDSKPFGPRWVQAMQAILGTYRQQQRLKDNGPYRFQRRSSAPQETLWEGLGYPTARNGLLHSGFRPSDDATTLSYLIPSNWMAATGLQKTSALLKQLGQSALADDFAQLGQQLRQLILSQAVYSAHGKQIYAYEINGLSSYLFMDDPNVPSLLSLPYLGCCSLDDPIYLQTRELILSPINPYFYEGKAARGLGSPHTPSRSIWPIGICMQALTSKDAEEIRGCLQLLKSSHAGTGFMHESFDVDDPARFTRPWFAWANSLFGELVVQVLEQHPQLL